MSESFLSVLTNQEAKVKTGKGMPDKAKPD